MNKKKGILLLAILSVVTSIVTFYTFNFLLSDLGNMFYGAHDLYIIASFPGFFIALDLILFSLYVARYCYRPQFKKRMTKTYSIILAVNSVLGIAASILTGTIIYGSFTAIYPFPGYTIICLILHILLLAFAIIARVVIAKRLEEDPEKRKTKFGYIIYTGVLWLTMLLSFDRLGALLLAPVYVHYRTLYLTWPFYASLLVPFALLFHMVILIFKMEEKHPKLPIIYISLVQLANIVFCGLVFLLGSKHTEFISAVSPALGLERLATKPIDMILQFGLVLILGLYILITAIIRYRKTKLAK